MPAAVPERPSVRTTVRIAMAKDAAAGLVRPANAAARGADSALDRSARTGRRARIVLSDVTRALVPMASATAPVAQAGSVLSRSVRATRRARTVLSEAGPVLVRTVNVAAQVGRPSRPVRATRRARTVLSEAGPVLLRTVNAAAQAGRVPSRTGRTTRRARTVLSDVTRAPVLVHTVNAAAQVGSAPGRSARTSRRVRIVLSDVTRALARTANGTTHVPHAPAAAASRARIRSGVPPVVGEPDAVMKADPVAPGAASSVARAQGPSDGGTPVSSVARVRPTRTKAAFSAVRAPARSDGVRRPGTVGNAVTTPVEGPGRAVGQARVEDAGPPTAEAGGRPSVMVVVPPTGAAGRPSAAAVRGTSRGRRVIRARPSPTT
jgi:hypothetical protein